MHSDFCVINPCNRRFVVIDTYKKIPRSIKDRPAERCHRSIVPGTYTACQSQSARPATVFTPIMINLADDSQLPPKRPTYTAGWWWNRLPQGKKATAREQADALTGFSLEKRWHFLPLQVWQLPLRSTGPNWRRSLIISACAAVPNQA